MNNTRLNNLSFAVFQVSLRVIGNEPVILPPYSGSALHGALGWALGGVAYGSKAQCPTCPVRSQCRYGDLFAYLFKAPADHPLLAPNYETLRRSFANRELRNLREFPPPYIIDPPPGGRYDRDELLTFNLTLIGRAIEFFPFFVCALEKTSERWLGSNRRARLVLEDIQAMDCAVPGSGVPIYDPFSKSLTGAGLVFDFLLVSQLAQAWWPDAGARDQLGVLFLTPLKFRKHEKVSSELDFVDLFRLVLRRIILLSVHSPLEEKLDQLSLLDKAASLALVATDLDFGIVERQKGHLVGALGKLIFSCDCNVSPLLPALGLCEFLHIGKAVTLGFGKYKIFFPGNGDFSGAG